MRIVLDTNVLISAFFSEQTPPFAALITVRDGTAIPLYDERIISEYLRVAAYPKFQSRLDPTNVMIAARGFRVVGELIQTRDVALPCSMPDPKDMPFAEVALAGRADAIVTGNRKHFPAALGVRVLSPAEYLSFLQS